MNINYINNFSLNCVDLKEVFRYSGGNNTDIGLFLSDKELIDLTQNCIFEVNKVLKPQVSWCEIYFNNSDYAKLFSFINTSDIFSSLITDCEKLILFAATIGIGVDKLIEKYRLVSPVKSVLINGIGSERAEALCDSFTGLMESKYSEAGFKLKPRFSPGYGDLPLGMQVEILRILDAQKIMGLYLNDSYLITPSKTVTAIIGLY